MVIELDKRKRIVLPIVISDKQRIIQHVQQRTGSNADTKDILTILKNIEDKQYRNVAEVTTAAGVVH